MFYISSPLTLAGTKVTHIVLAPNVGPSGGCDDTIGFINQSTESTGKRLAF